MCMCVFGMILAGLVLLAQSVGTVECVLHIVQHCTLCEDSM